MMSDTPLRSEHLWSAIGEFNNFPARAVLDDLKTMLAENEQLRAQLTAERDAHRIADANLTGDLHLAEDEIKRLRAELEALRAASEWEDVPFGTYQTESEMVTIADNGSEDFPLYFSIGYDEEKAWCGLPKEWRLQRRKPADKGHHEARVEAS